MKSSQCVFCLFSLMFYSGEANNDMVVDEEKVQLRQRMTGVLKNMSEKSRKFESDMTILTLLNHPSFRTRDRFGVYLHTELEVHTDKLVKNILGKGQRCFIPRRNGTSMEMVILRSIDDYNSMKVNEWGFKEPDLYEKRENALDKGGLDIMVLPGVAFTLKGERLGRGRGMYDKYIASIRPKHNPALFGLAYEAQILKQIPMDSEDIKVDTVMHMKYTDN